MLGKWKRILEQYQATTKSFYTGHRGSTTRTRLVIKLTHTDNFIIYIPIGMWITVLFSYLIALIHPRRCQWPTSCIIEPAATHSARINNNNLTFNTAIDGHCAHFSSNGIIISTYSLTVSIYFTHGSTFTSSEIYASFWRGSLALCLMCLSLITEALWYLVLSTRIPFWHWDQQGCIEARALERQEFRRPNSRPILVSVARHHESRIMHHVCCCRWAGGLSRE